MICLIPCVCYWSHTAVMNKSKNLKTAHDLVSENIKTSVLLWESTAIELSFDPKHMAET